MQVKEHGLPVVGLESLTNAAGELRSEHSLDGVHLAPAAAVSCLEYVLFELLRT